MCVFPRDLIGLLPEDSANCNCTNNEQDLGQCSSFHNFFIKEDQNQKGQKDKYRRHEIGSILDSLILESRITDMSNDFNKTL